MQIEAIKVQLNSDIIAIFSLLVTIIATIFSIYQNRRAHKLQINLEKEHKKRIEKKIQIEFFETAITKIIFTGEFPLKSIIKVPFKYCVANIGKTKIKNPELYVTYPNFIHEKDLSNLVYKPKGNISEPGIKLVDESAGQHMLGFKIDDLPPAFGVFFEDQFIVSQYKKTNTTVADLEVEVEAKDKSKFKLNYRATINWVIQFFLKHDDGSYSNDCYVNFWDTRFLPLEEYLDTFKPESDIVFENYLRNFGFIARKLNKKGVKSIWNRTIKENILFLELEFKRDSFNYPKPKGVPKELKELDVFEAVISKQKVLNVLNDGSVIAINREDFEKIARLSKLNVTYRGLSGNI